MGPGSQTLGARLGAGASRNLASSNLGPGQAQKSPGRREAKGWETAETAAAEVGAWREAGTGYPPTHPPTLNF